MINLYAILGIEPTATASQIQATLTRQQNQLDPKTIKAVQEWLLVPDVRQRYDARLRQEQPAFFETHNHHHNPTVIQQTLAKEQKDFGYYTPKLYNPTAIAVWALIISPIIGAWLTAINWHELGNREAAKHNMYVVYGTIAFGVASIFLYCGAAIKIPFYSGSLISLAWYFTIGKKQADFLHQEAGDDYMRKKWGKVLMWIACGAITYLFVSYVILYLFLISGNLHPIVIQELQEAAANM